MEKRSKQRLMRGREGEMREIENRENDSLMTMNDKAKRTFPIPRK